MKAKESIALEFLGKHPQEAALVLEAFSSKELSTWLATVPLHVRGQLLASINPVVSQQYISTVSAPVAAQLLDAMRLTDAVPILRRCSRETSDRLLSKMRGESARRVRRVLRFPDNSAGALANVDASVLRSDMTIREARNRLRQDSGSLQGQIIVVDSETVISGYIEFRDILRRSGREAIANLVQKNMGRINAAAFPEEVLAHPDWRRFSELPVANVDGSFVGTLKYAKVQHLVSETGSTESESREAAMSAIDDLYRVGFSGILKGVGATIFGSKAK